MDSRLPTPALPNPIILHTTISGNGMITPSTTPVEDEHKKRVNVSCTQEGFAFISHSSLTFPTREPEIDNMQLARRRRRRTSPTELNILETEFNRCFKPSKVVREDIARRVSMTEKAVQIWFQNRRQSYRKHQQRDQNLNNDDDVNNLANNTNENDRSGGITPFEIYQDEENNCSSKVRLSMSDDGKAQVVFDKKTNNITREALSPIKNLENKSRFNITHNSGKRLTLSEAAVASSLKHKQQQQHQLYKSKHFPKKPHHLKQAAPISSLVHNYTPTNHNMINQSQIEREAECINNLLSLRSGEWN